MDIPFREQVILNPDDLADCSHQRDFARHRQMRMRQQGLSEDVLDESKTGTDVDVLDVKRVQARLAAVHQTGEQSEETSGSAAAWL